MELRSSQQIPYFVTNAVVLTEKEILDRYVYDENKHSEIGNIINGFKGFGEALIILINGSYRHRLEEQKEVDPWLYFRNSSYLYHFLEMLVEEKISIEGLIKKDKFRKTKEKHLGEDNEFISYDRLEREPANRVIINQNRSNFNWMDKLAIDGIKEPISFQHFVNAAIDSFSYEKKYDRFNGVVNSCYRMLMTIFTKAAEHYEWLNIDYSRTIAAANYTTRLKCILSEEKKKELLSLQENKYQKIETAIKNDQRLKQAKELLLKILPEYSYNISFRSIVSNDWDF